jgi:hypothetical protein
VERTGRKKEKYDVKERQKGAKDKLIRNEFELLKLIIAINTIWKPSIRRE